MGNIYDFFIITIIVAITLIILRISKGAFHFLLKKDLPIEVLKDKLKTNGYIFKSYKEIGENILPKNINFDKLQKSYFYSYYIKSFYQILVIDDVQKNEEYIYLKYYQSSIHFLSDKYFFKK